MAKTQQPKLVSDAADVRARIAQYNQELSSGAFWKTKPEKGHKSWKNVLRSSKHWVFDPSTGRFCPSKYVGYLGITIREYLTKDSYRDPNSATLQLSGSETDKHLRSLAKKDVGFIDHDFLPPTGSKDPILQDFRKWADQLFPPDLRPSLTHAEKLPGFGFMRLAQTSKKTGPPKKTVSVKSGGGVRLSKAERDAIENRAMVVAENYLRQKVKCRTVTPVPSENRGYDIDCVAKNRKPLHVEVKGVSTKGEAIRITANEVKHAREAASNGSIDQLMLLIVANIQLSSDPATGSPIASGGNVRILHPWDIDADGSLKPLVYKYEISNHRSDSSWKK